MDHNQDHLSASLEHPFQLVFEQIPLGVLLQNSNGTVIAANPAAQKILGGSLEELQERTATAHHWDAIHPDGSHFPAAEQPAMQALHSGETVRNVVMGIFNPQTKAYNWVDVSAIPQFEKPGEPPSAVLSTLEDIASGKSSYRGLAESIQDGFFELDRDWRFTYINQRAANNVGCLPDDLIGKNIWEAFPAILGTLHEQHYRTVMTQRQPVSFDMAGTLTRQSYTIRVYPSSQGISVFWVDISERIQAETALQKSEQKFSALFDQAAVPLALTRLSDHVLLDVNEAWVRLLGYTKQDVLGKAIEELGILREPATRQRSVDAMQSDGSIQGMEAQIYTKSGEVRTIITNINRVEIGGQTYVLTSVQDITERKQAEEALRRLDARWNGAIESFDIGVIIASEDEQVIYWNPAAQQMLSFTRPDEGIEPLEQTTVTFQLWTLDKKHLLDLDEWPMRRIKRGEPVHNLELCIRRPDQGWEKIFSYSGVMVDTTGGERLIFLTCQDITQKRHTEDALRQSEERLRMALEAGRMVAWDYDPATLKVTFSDNAEAVLEIPQWLENSDQGYDLIHPDDVEHHRTLVTQAIQTGSTYVSVYRHPHPKTQIWIEEHGQAVVDQAGNTVRLVGMLQNITGRKQAEEKLSRLLERLDLATRSARMGIWDWDIANNQLVWDDQMYALYGVVKGAFAGAYDAWLKGVHPEDRAASDEVSAQARRGERAYDTEFRVIWPDGSIHWLKALGDVFCDSEGNPLRMLGVNYDITAIKEAHTILAENNQQLERRVADRTIELSMANAELVRANRAKDEFLSTMSHELRTPLNGILTLSESLQEGTYGALAANQIAKLITIRESGEHLLELINDILDISKAESGRMELAHETVALDGLIQSAMRLITPQATKKHLRIHTELDSGLGTIAADPRRLKQMLVNLLGNAVKFTPENGHIGLEVIRENDGESLRFLVWDSGIGIPADQINHLFQPFVQIDSSLSREYAGTGLGLALVSRLAQLHGGSVGVESEPGKGSRFWFSIPVLQVIDSSVEPPAEGNIAEQALPAPRRALLIEDSALAADHLANYLRELNTEVIIHRQGIGAVQAAIEARPDVILLDILLPDTNGWQVLLELKTHFETRDIPVVIVSVVDERKQGLVLGAAEYLVKPVTRQDLHVAISKAIAPNQQPNRVLVIRHDEQPQTEQTPAGKGKLIIIAEDNLVNLDGYADYLKSKGYRVIPALNGFEAIERVEEFKPDLVLMDIQMPGMDGLEAIRRLRSKPELHKLPIIALTALTMPGDRERCLAIGANAYLAKPVGMKLLIQEIEKLI